MVPDQPRIDLLGTLAVHYRGRTVTDLGGRRQRTALAALALAEGPVTADRLADIVWSGQPPATWPAALRNVIAGMRSAVEPLGLGEQRLIVTEPTGYRLVDVRTDLTDPAALRRRPRLLLDVDHEFFDEHRRRLDRRHRELLESLAETDLTAAEQLVGEYPLDERGHRLLIRALDRAGDRPAVVAAYERCRAVLADQLGIDPGPDTVSAYLAALGTDDGPKPAWIPRPDTTFVDRPELTQLRQVAGRPGLVTLTGRGGIGKSRLAVEFASRSRARVPVRWVDLSAVPADELVAGQVATVLGADGDDPIAALVEVLAPVGPVLLVLDGAEQLTSGTAVLVSGLIRGCPQLTVVVTSRGALHVDGEQVLAIGGLSDGSVLLADRLRRAGRPEPAPQVLDELARRCAGVPLALELVAGRLTDLAPADLLDELPIGMDGLIASSYASLADDEAAVFRRMAVLAGPAPLDLIRQVTRVTGPRTARILRGLADLGLVTLDPSEARWQYRLDDDIRRFADARLDEDGEVLPTFESLRDAVRALLPEDATAAPSSYADAVDGVLGSVRSLLAAAAHGRIERDAGLEIAFRLHRYFSIRSVPEGRYWLTRLLADPGQARWAGRAAFASGYLSYWAGDTTGAEPMLQRAADLLGPEDRRFAARALIYLGGIGDDLDDGPRAVGHLRCAVQLAAEVRDPNLQVAASIGIGAVLAERGDPEAVDFAEQAVATSRAHGSPEQLGMLLATGSTICWQVGQHHQCREMVHEATTLLGDRPRIASVALLASSAVLELSVDRAAAAADFAALAANQGRELGVERELPVVYCLLAVAQHLCDAPAAPEMLRAFTSARSLSYQHPLAWCLEATTLVTGDRSYLGPAAALRTRGSRPRPPFWRRLLGEDARPGGDGDVDAAVEAAVAALSRSAP